MDEQFIEIDPEDLALLGGEGTQPPPEPLPDSGQTPVDPAMEPQLDLDDPAVRAAAGELGEAGAFLQDLVLTPLRAPVNAVGEALEGAASITDAGLTAVGQGDLIPDDLEYQPFESATEEGALVEGFARWLVGFGGWSKGLKLTGAALRLGKQPLMPLVAGAMTDFSVFDEQQGRLVDLLAETAPDLRNPVIDFLRSNPEDSEAFGRFKTALEGAALGGAVDGVLKAIGMLRQARWLKTTQGEQSAKDFIAQNADELDEPMDILFGRPKVEMEVSAKILPPGAADEMAPTPAATADEAPPQSALERGDTPTPQPTPATKEPPPELVEEVTEKLRQKLSDDSAGSGTPLDMASVFKNTTPEDLPSVMVKLMKQTADRLEATAGPARPDGEITNAQTRQQASRLFEAEVDTLADLLGTDHESLAYRLMRDAGNIERARINATVSRSMSEALLNQMVLAAKANNLPQLEALKKAYDQVSLPTRQVGSSAGRLLQSFQMEGGGLTEKVAQQLNKTPGLGAADEAAGGAEDAMGGRSIEALAKDIRLADNLHAVSRLVSNASEALISYRINAMLSGPETHLFNIASNFSKAVMTPTERLLGSGFGLLDKQVAAESIALYEGQARAVLDAWKMATKAFREGSTLRAAKTIEQDNPTAFWNIFGWPGRLLGAEDEFFQQIAYRGQLWAETVMRATKQGLERGTPEWNQFMAEEFSKGFSKTGAGINTNALSFAENQTFTKSLRPTQSLPQAVGFWLSMGTASKNPLLRTIARHAIPFIRTPANIIEDFVEHAPGVPFIPGMSHKVMSALEAGGTRRAEILGKQMTGMGTLAGAMLLAQSGILTGNGPVDPRQKKAWMDAGWRPNSIRILDPKTGQTTYFPIDRFEPWGPLMGMAADLSAAAGYMKDDEIDMAFQQLTASIANTLTGKKMLTGLNDLMALLTTAAEGEADQRVLENYTASYVPSLFRIPRNAVDPYRREVERLLYGPIYNRIPGFSSQLPPVLDTLGQPLPAPGLMNISATEEGPVYREMRRLMDAGGIFERTPYRWRNSKLHLFDFKREDGVTAYERMGELMRTIKLDAWGEGNETTLQETLEQALKREDYTSLPDPIDADYGNTRRDKADAINKIVGAYRRAAQELLLDEEFVNARGETLEKAVLTKAAIEQATTQEEADMADQQMEEVAPDTFLEEMTKMFGVDDASIQELERDPEEPTEGTATDLLFGTPSTDEDNP